MKWRSVEGMWDADDDCCERRSENSNPRKILQEKEILGVPRTTPVHTVRAIVHMTLTVRGMDIISVGRPA